MASTLSLFLSLPSLAASPPRQQVQDEDPALLRLADELDPEGLAAVPLDQHHLDDRAVVGARGGVAGRPLGARGGDGADGGGGVGLCAGLEALLLQDGEPQHGAGLPQDGDGPGVRHGGQAAVVHLGNRTPRGRSEQHLHRGPAPAGGGLASHVPASSRRGSGPALGPSAYSVPTTPDMDYLRFYPLI